MSTSSLTRARISTTKRTAHVELPACWQVASVNAAINALDRKKPNARRLVENATKLASVGVSK